MRLTRRIWHTTTNTNTHTIELLERVIEKSSDAKQAGSFWSCIVFACYTFTFTSIFWTRWTKPLVNKNEVYLRYISDESAGPLYGAPWLENGTPCCYTGYLHNIEQRTAGWVVRLQHNLSAPLRRAYAIFVKLYAARLLCMHSCRYVSHGHIRRYQADVRCAVDIQFGENRGHKLCIGKGFDVCEFPREISAVNCTLETMLSPVCKQLVR